MVDGVEGVDLVGIFFPTSEWHCVMAWNATSYEKALQAYKTYLEKYGRPKTSLGKVESFHTSEELPSFNLSRTMSKFYLRYAENA